MCLPNSVDLPTDSKPRTNYEKTSVCLSPKIMQANQQKIFVPSVVVLSLGGLDSVSVCLWMHSLLGWC